MSICWEKYPPMGSESLLCTHQTDVEDKNISYPIFKIKKIVNKDMLNIRVLFIKE